MNISGVLKLTFCICIAGRCFAQEDMLLDKINAERASKRIRPLEYDSTKQKSVNTWVRRLEKSMVHAPGKHGETIGAFPDDPGLIVPLFMSSPSHRDVLLDKSARRACIALYRVAGDTIQNKNGIEYRPTLIYAVIRTYQN